MNAKKLLEAEVHFDVVGNMMPIAIKRPDDWDMIPIDKVDDVRRTSGNWIRYAIEIRGQYRYLFYDEIDNNWFITPQ